MKTTLLFLSVIIAAAGMYPYVRATIRGTVRPHLVSWSIWTVLGAVLTISSLLKHDLPSALLSAQGFVDCALIVALGWRRGTRRVARLDVVCILGAVAGISSLILLSNPTLALLVAVTVDALAFVPSLLHAWQSPEEEAYVSYLCAAIGGTLVLLAALTTSSRFTGLVYPLYSIVFNTVMTVIILGRPWFNETAEYEYEGEVV